VEQAVLGVRLAHPAWGGRKISRVLERDHALQIAPSTVTHVLHRHGLITAGASAAATPWQRFEHEHPNSLWQMDFKGHFPIDSGRCHALTVLDDHSRYNIVLAACENEQRSSVQARLSEAFWIYGLPQRINTDNGSPWGTSGGSTLTGLGVWLVRLGVGLSHSTPLHPQTNGKEERFHRSLKAEVLQQRYVDLPHVQGAFDRWRDIYNLERPHQALNMATPAERYRPSPRPMPSTLPDIEYASDDLVRKVSTDGWLSLRGHDVRVSRALIGQHVAFRPRAQGIEGIYDLFFCHHRLGEIDLRTSQKP
jgi:transposase InsO family protein